MQSFLIISKDKKLLDEQANNLCQEYKVDPLDVYTVESEKAIGIEDIRTIQKQLFLKPFKSDKKAIIIKNAQTLTIEAQNAFLKSLEEPPQHTIIILCTENGEVILPTIHSRCKIIKVSKNKSSDQTKNFSYSEDINSLPNLSIGEKLVLAQKLEKNKEEALLFLQSYIIELRSKLIDFSEIQTETSNLLNKIKILQSTYTIISTTNVNIRLALENLLLSLS